MHNLLLSQTIVPTMKQSLSGFPIHLCVLAISFCVLGRPATGQESNVVFQEDFESGLERWEILDPKTWKLNESVSHSQSPTKTLAITARESEYQPPFRSPLHIALVKDLSVGNVEISFRVRSTLDTGDHRDCCVFFGYQDDKHFYYVHVGAKPDPHSGQIMIVNKAPRLALTKNTKETPWDDQWHTVKLIRNIETGMIQLFFDDMTKPHMEVADKTFGAGRIGIGSFDDLNEFDDIMVRTF